MCCCGSACTARALSGTCFWVLCHEPSWCQELHVAGNAAELQGWPLSAETFWCPGGSHRRLFGVSSLFKERALETFSPLTTELLK